MKNCLIIGNKNAITYKEVFPLFKTKNVRLGYGVVKTFNTKDRTRDFGNVGWYTTLPVTDKEPLVLTARYSPEKYPKYDNYNAIEVGALKDIPFDYSGVMGVPITILDKNLDRVEIIGRSHNIEFAQSDKCFFFNEPNDEECKKFKAQNKTWRRQVPYIVENGIAKSFYNRIFIRKVK